MTDYGDLPKIYARLARKLADDKIAQGMESVQAENEALTIISKQAEGMCVIMDDMEQQRKAKAKS